MEPRTDSDEVERLWEDFHAAVNMSSRELRAWLLTDASDEHAFAEPDLRLNDVGQRIVGVLSKRKTDLTPDDAELMAEVVRGVRARLADPPPRGAADPGWRHALMRLGHDPLKATAGGPPDLPQPVED
jgi:hypothetical protein